MPASRLPFFAALAGGLLLCSTSLSRAAEGGFGATLSADQQTAAGLPALSVAERAALDQLVTGELMQVRRGELPELAGTFTGRRSDAERKSAGLDRLTAAELARLDEFVAAALAARPKPRERPRIKDGDVLVAAPKAEIHGGMSLTYGWGGGGTFRASSFWVEYFDPASGLGLGVGISNISGNGFYGYYPDYYGYGSRYYGAEPAYLDLSYRNGPRNDFSYGSGQSFCAPAYGDFSGRGRRRR